jgi:hypothetical protein
MRPRTIAFALAGVVLAACSSSPSGGGGPATTADPTPGTGPTLTTSPGQTTPEAIAADLRAHGFKVGPLKPSEALLVRESVDTTIDGVEAGINTFDSVETATAWAETSRSFGGVAVVGDTWAVSLDSDQPGKAKSLKLAPRIAAEIGGQVVT